MKISREHKALVLFFALALAGLGFAFYYITNLGHSWNVAASAIDDMSGELQGYTAILYEGTAEEQAVEKADDPLTALERSFVADLNKKSGEQSASEGEVTASQAISNGEDSNSEAVFDIQSLKRVYAEKGASVFVINLSNPSLYYEKTIIKGGKNVYGVLTVDKEHCSKEYLAQRVKEYKSAGVDLVIAVTSSYDLITDFEGINVVISIEEEGLSNTGVSSDGVFYKDAAMKGEIGTILVSPSRVFSAKDVSSL